MLRRATLLAPLLIVVGGGARVLRAQSPVQIRFADLGPGTGPSVLGRAILAPYFAIAPAAQAATLRRDTTYSTTVVVLGRDAIVEATVRGDVIVVGGDLYMHPGGRIVGRAVSIGGGVYESMLARIDAGISAYRDFTYDIAASNGTYTLTYRELVPRESSPISWPGIFGFSIPTYDRSNGLSIGVGPRIALPNTRLTVEPRLIYRSQLGAIDASAVVTDSLSRRTAIALTAKHSTYSNDSWIWSDLLNSAEFLVFGHDSRNYFRGGRIDLTIGHRIESAAWKLTPSITARYEQTHSVRPDSSCTVGATISCSGPTGGPFTFFGRHDEDDRLRANPRVAAGNIASFIGAAGFDWEGDGIIAGLRVDLEAGRFEADLSDAPIVPPVPNNGSVPQLPSFFRDGSFGQATLDGSISFSTFGTQSLEFTGHAVLTTPGPTPRQRYAYVGGPGTIPTLEMLQFGGDQLLYLDAAYSIPIDRLKLPLVGPPTVVIRHAMGSAGVGRLPELEQATGIRLIVSILYGEFLVDPATGNTHRTVGLSFAR
ncbi:MAG TPA: hypothetical protein VGP95_11285 [Gemmatimonadaceae bacterium]|nr:hypothetical protein [Gemmatimonadaceae bacterium]